MKHALTLLFSLLLLHGFAAGMETASKPTHKDTTSFKIGRWVSPTKHIQKRVFKTYGITITTTLHCNDVIGKIIKLKSLTSATQQENSLNLTNRIGYIKGHYYADTKKAHMFELSLEEKYKNSPFEEQLIWLMRGALHALGATSIRVFTGSDEKDMHMYAQCGARPTKKPGYMAIAPDHILAKL
jgi:hypothetical protein